MTPRNHQSTHPWTTAAEQELRRLARENKSATEIAARLSRSPEQVFERAHELGLNLSRGETKH
jgi:DNA-binding CsgD family transcriptional regulator